MISNRWLAALVAAALAATAFTIWAGPREHRISSYATSLTGRNRAQRHNAIRALRRLSGALIKPGQTFSFNATVGSFSRDDGYKKAPVSYSGQLIDSWGGGVCQTSTTLYNAALLAGMKIVERHHHEFCPSYVAPGRDAAVAFDDIDLKFENPYRFPVWLETTAEGGVLRVDFLSEKALPSSISVVAKVHDIQRPAEFDIGSLGRGGRIRNSGKPGYDVAVYRIENGARELVSADSYPVMNRVVEFGG